MKTLLPTALALLAGFAGGWIAKPASTPIHGGIDRTPPTASPVVNATTPDDSPPPPPVRERILPPIPQPGIHETRPANPAVESIEGAKLRRLVELLGLDDASRKKLEGILDDCRQPPTGDPSKPVNPRESLDLLAKTGAALEQSLAALFTPEQATAFAELRKREQQNRIESKAQRDLGRIAETTDLTTDQRELILAKLRQSVTTELESLPPTVSLLSSSSVLPMGTVGMPVDSMIELSHLSSLDPAADHGAAFAQLSELKLARLDAQLAELKPLVTPAQYAQLEAAAAQQREIRQRILQPRPLETPPAPPGNQ